MKIVISIMVLIIIFAFIAETTISFTPFKITFKSLPIAIGTTLIIIAIGCFKYQWKKEGYSEAMKDATEIVKKSY